jgi:hypothetical protein
MLHPITRDLWHGESSVRLVPGAHLPIRMTVIRRRDGSLILHSPIELDDAGVAELTELGDVRTVIAPNAMHHLHARAALDRFPRARCLVAAGVHPKNPGLRDANSLDQHALELDDELEAIPIGGMPNLNEWVFRHRPSGFLITSDLVFNVRQPQGWLTPWVMRAAGTHRRLAVSRLVAREIRDRSASFESLRRVLREPITGLVMAHGEVVEHGADAALRAALHERFPDFEA